MSTVVDIDWKYNGQNRGRWDKTVGCRWALRNKYCSYSTLSHSSDGLLGSYLISSLHVNKQIHFMEEITFFPTGVLDTMRTWVRSKPSQKKICLFSNCLDFHRLLIMFGFTFCKSFSGIRADPTPSLRCQGLYCSVNNPKPRFIYYFVQWKVLKFPARYRQLITSLPVFESASLKTQSIILCCIYSIYFVMFSFV